MQPIKPLTTLQSIILFSVSALFFWCCIHLLMPWLLYKQLHPFAAFLLSYSLLLGSMLIATYIGITVEANREHWRERLRLNNLSVKNILICIGIFAIGFVLTGLLFPVAKIIASVSAFSPAPYLPDVVNPLKSNVGTGLTSFMGIPLFKSYWIIPVYFLFLAFFNILGEELWFRGYILPKQELTWRNKTWIYHGILWCLFHTPVYPWMIIYLLPTTLSVSFAAQKMQSTWAGYLVHFLGNCLLAMIPIIIGVFTNK